MLRRVAHSRRLAALALCAFVYAQLVGPGLHAQHHARYGADHHHGTGPHGAAHAAFHDDTAALALAEVATAGVLEVDCAYAEYTLAACGDDGHAPHFGDALVEHTQPDVPADPTEHGRGALEHLQLALLSPAQVLLPPPALALLPRPLTLRDDQHAPATARTHAPRGPPV